VNKVEILYTPVCKWKNDICWNYSRNGGWEGWKGMVERVNSSMRWRDSSRRTRAKDYKNPSQPKKLEWWSTTVFPAMTGA
jgi:hypothetical protein